MIRWSCCLAFVLVGLAGCATRTPVHAPELDQNPLPEATPEPFRISAGDRLAIRFWGNPELDQEVTVRPDGIITLPFVDEVDAAGRRPSEVDAELTRLYQDELASPEITVMVLEIRPSRVHVGGEVTRPGAVEILDDGLTLYKAVQEAGGFLTSARIAEILLIRVTPAGEAIARSVDLRPLLRGKDPTADVRLEPRDLVYVPRTRIANVNLFVEQYITEVLPFQTFTAIRTIGIAE